MIIGFLGFLKQSVPLSPKGGREYLLGSNFRFCGVPLSPKGGRVNRFIREFVVAKSHWGPQRGKRESLKGNPDLTNFKLTNPKLTNPKLTNPEFVVKAAKGYQQTPICPTYFYNFRK